MPAPVLSIAVAGFRAASFRLSASAHNLANLGTEGFRPLRARQSAQPGGGVEATFSRAEAPEAVDVGRELVEQLRARLQAGASLLVVGEAQKTHGRLIDLVA